MGRDDDGAVRLAGFRPVDWFLPTTALFINQPLQYFSLTQSVAIVFCLFFLDRRMEP